MQGGRLYMCVCCVYTIFLPWWHKHSWVTPVPLPGRKIMYICVSCMGLPGGSDSNESSRDAGCWGSIPGSGRSPGVGNPLQYPCLENSMGREAWQATVHGVAKSWTQLSNLRFHFYFSLCVFIYIWHGDHVWPKPHIFVWDIFLEHNFHMMLRNLKYDIKINKEQLL